MHPCPLSPKKSSIDKLHCVLYHRGMDKRLISTQAFFADLADLLKDGRQAAFTVTGMSMRPVIRHNRDRVVVRAPLPSELKKGDVVLVRASGDRYLLHRITRIRGDFVETTGDGNCFHDGYFPRDSVIAIVTVILRKGQEIDCRSLRWRLFSLLWMGLFPCRRLLFAAAHRLRRLFPRKESN